MRLGKRHKKSPRNAWPTAGEKVKPKNVAADSVVGQISSDWISSVFAPKFQELAGATLEKYADDLLKYEDALKEENSSETEINQDGTTPDPVAEPYPPLFDSQPRIDEFSSILTETADHFFASSGGWRIHANAHKFERMLDEKYGVFRPFITNHPEVEVFVRTVQRKYAMGEFSPIRQGDPPIPRSTAIIILFMMQRGGVQWQILLLAFLFFLVGLQPWALVGFLMLVQTLRSRRINKAIGTMPRHIPSTRPYYEKENGEETTDAEKLKLLKKPVGAPLKDTERIDTSAYDTMILGQGIGALYTGALLSRAGRKVLILCREEDASGCATIAKDSPIPFDLNSHNITKISKNQRLLVPALCSDSDCQGGIRFAQIGSELDGYAFEILSIPGVGTEKADQQIPFILKSGGGLHSLMEDAGLTLGDGWPSVDGSVGQSTTGEYVQACEKINSVAGDFYLSKVLPENSLIKGTAQTLYQNAAAQPAEAFLNPAFPHNPHTRSLMAGVGLKTENLRPSKASMGAHVTNVCAALSGEGVHYPIGGPRALGHALATVIEQSGGRVITQAQMNEFLFVEDKKAVGVNTAAGSEESKKLPAPTCTGVKLSDGSKVHFSPDRFDQGGVQPVVISMLPFIETFIRMFPDDTRNKYGCPRALAALSEQRPVFQLLFSMEGSASDLSLTGADYYRLPGAARAFDEINPETNAVKHGEIGWADEDEQNVAEGAEGAADSTSTNEMTLTGEEKKKRKTRNNKKYEPGISWMQISFPSAKDPSFDSRHKKVSTCVVTIEADDDFVTNMGTNPVMYSTKKVNNSFVEGLKQLQAKVLKDVCEIFPQLTG